MLPTRVLVTAAGSGASNNLVQSLFATRISANIIGAHSDPFTLRKSPAHGNYLTPAPTDPEYPAALRWIIESEKIDLLIPTTDIEVRAVSYARETLPCRLFLPSKSAIELCQDKYELTRFLRKRRIPAPITYPVTSLADVDAIFDRFEDGHPLWCRIRTGTASFGAAPMRTSQQARNWIAYWNDMRGVAPVSFTLSEYLPGRDFACQSLWKDGRLILIKTCERLSYYGGTSGASGVSSTPALAKTVRESRVVRICTRAIRAVDPLASGVFAVDLKENAAGTPCITEINAGRFFMISPIFDLTGRHSMAATYLRLALGEPVEISNSYDVADDWYLVRDLDTVPHIFHGDSFFDGIREPIL